MKDLKFLLLISTIFMLSCTGNEEMAKVEQKKAQVMEVHDIAMEKMGEMVKLKTSLKTSLADKDSVVKLDFQKAIKDLEVADKAMWDWMHGYHHEVVDTSSFENAMKYLEDQGKDIDEVAVMIEESLKNGYALLETVE